MYTTTSGHNQPPDSVLGEHVDVLVSHLLLQKLLLLNFGQPPRDVTLGPEIQTSIKTQIYREHGN